MNLALIRPVPVACRNDPNFVGLSHCRADLADLDRKKLLTKGGREKFVFLLSYQR